MCFVIFVFFFVLFVAKNQNVLIRQSILASGPTSVDPLLNCQPVFLKQLHHETLVVSDCTLGAVLVYVTPLTCTVIEGEIVRPLLSERCLLFVE